MKLLTAAQMRAIEAHAMDRTGVSGLDLMERAGRGVVEAMFEERPALAAAPGRAAVLCGPGNNGGDGFVVARLLSGKGWEVALFLYGDEAKLPPDAAENCRRWREIGDVRPLAAFRADAGAAPAVIIDALFGIGLARPLADDALEAVCEADIQRRRDDGPFVVAVDIPSGLCADSGRVLLDPTRPEDEDGRCCPGADLTVTFEHAKRGHHLVEDRARCGTVRIVSLGLGVDPDDALSALPPIVELARPRLDRVSKDGGHKYAHGHAFILSGGVGKGGAARLAARSALRVGAGLVTLGAPPAAIIENAARLDAIMLARIADAEALSVALRDERITALALGPGLGVGEATRNLVRAALTAKRAAVLDADALTAFAEAPEALFALTRGSFTVMTPHMGEFRRLFPDIHAKLAATPAKGPAYSKIDAAREAAARAGCVVLLKGPDTVVADETGAASVVSALFERACPWLATAGAGDVLAGMIAGLLARGLDATAAAETAAWLHQEAALAFGPGLIAEDLPEALPAVFRKSGLAGS